MKKLRYLYTDGDHKWAVVARDPERPPFVIDTNEYLIVKGDDAILTDPGGLEIFPVVFTAVSQEFNPERINKIFSSHQDPDIISSLGLWLEVNPDIRCHLSWLWRTFVPHFGGTRDTFVSIPDEGVRIPLGDIELEAIPAHYLHSCGNFNLWDPKAKILFSGDIGAALLPPGKIHDLFVSDFDVHLPYITVFHQRWMASNQAKNDWCRRVRELKPEMICPQHGSIYKGEMVTRFIDWFEALEVGVLGVTPPALDLSGRG